MSKVYIETPISEAPVKNGEYTFYFKDRSSGVFKYPLLNSSPTPPGAVSWLKALEVTEVPEISFSISSDEIRILTWPAGGCKPANDSEIELWDAYHSALPTIALLKEESLHNCNRAIEISKERDAETSRRKESDKAVYELQKENDRLKEERSNALKTLKVESEENAKLKARVAELEGETKRKDEALKRLRSYFGENDKTMQEHAMYAVADQAIKPLS